MDMGFWKPSGAEQPSRRGVRIWTVNMGIMAAAVLLLFSFFWSSYQTESTYKRLQDAMEKYAVSELAANTLRHASDNMTTNVRLFAFTQDHKYLDRYIEEVYVLRHRQQAVDTLAGYMEGAPAHRSLEYALWCSNRLMDVEAHSISLVAAACGCPIEEPLEDKRVASDLALSPEEALQKAQDLIHSEEYRHYDDLIDLNVDICLRTLGEGRLRERQEIRETLIQQQWLQNVLASLLVAVSLAAVGSVYFLVIRPLNADGERISQHQPLPMRGARELRDLAREYNAMHEEILRSSAHLRHQAEHDSLTGLYNRGAFEKLRAEYANAHFALLLIDVDLFKHVNDNYGHDVGDKVLQKVAGQLDRNFRHTDYPCRIGGDEFAVIMTNVSFPVKGKVREKLHHIGEALRDTSDGLPAVTLSVGAAFNDHQDGTGDIFKDADQALYAVKTHGRNAYEFYGENSVKI